MPSQHRTRRGYVLLVALALTALAAVVVVGLSRLAMQRIVQSRQSAQDLQRKWGIASCRLALLEDAELLLRQADARGELAPEPPAVLDESIVLGGLRFDVRVADEQAKANINALISRGGEVGAERAIRRLSGASPLGARMRLRGQDGNEWAIGSFGQVFEDPQPGDLLGDADRSEPAPVDSLTCWGSGAINVRRSSPLVLRQLLGDELTAARLDAALKLRREMRQQARATPSGEAPAQPPAPMTVEQFVQATQMEAEAGEALRQRLTDRSRCWSVWVTATSGRRQWHWLTVREILGRRTERLTTLTW